LRYSFHSMSGFGGATHGHLWSEFEFVENHPRLDINAVHRAGALTAGVETVWQWENGLKGSLRATYGRIFLRVGNREQTIRIDWLPFLNNHYVRPRFLCPGCGRGCYHMHEKAGTWACSRCCGYDFKSRHRWRFSPAFRRISRLRKKLGADPRPLSSLRPRPRWRMSRVYYDRLVAELARAEAAAYADVGRLLADLNKRLKP
jgi:ribosomal protein L37AE/L43A